MREVGARRKKEWWYPICDVHDSLEKSQPFADNQVEEDKDREAFEQRVLVEAAISRKQERGKEKPWSSEKQLASYCCS